MSLLGGPIHIWVFQTDRVPPSQDRRGKVLFLVCQSTPRWGGGYPVLPMGGPPSQVRMGVPFHQQHGVPPLRQDEGSPPPPLLSGPRSGRGGVTPKWNSTACTCNAASGISLAFTQEDFIY